MTERSRSPYLVVGVDYGTNIEVARQAWARRARSARRDPQFPYSIEMLNEALERIQHADNDPATSVDWFRVPLDPVNFIPPQGEGLFRPTAVPAQRRSDPLDPEEVRSRVEAIAVEASLRLLGSAKPAANPNPYQRE